MSDPYLLRPDHSPTPYTDDEIREASPPGRTVRSRFEPAGAPPTVRVVTYVGGDVTTARQTTARQTVGAEDSDGNLLDEPFEVMVSWRDLQFHAPFPASATHIDRETVDVPAGTFDCLRYAVDTDDGVDTFWFAVDRPGMPVLMRSVRDVQEVLRITMLSDSIEDSIDDGLST